MKKSKLAPVLFLLLGFGLGLSACGGGGSEITDEQNEGQDSGTDVGGSDSGQDTGVEPACGDGQVDPGEACDEGPANQDTAACTSTCQTATCGDGLVLQGVEDCDDNDAACVGCIAQCGFGKLVDCGVLRWQTHFGADAPLESQGFGVTVDAQGNTLVIGDFKGTVDFGDGDKANQGQTDIFISKHDAAGALVWVKTFGGAGFDFAKGLAVDNDGNIYVAGGGTTANLNFGGIMLAGGLFIAKLDTDGNVLWAKSYSNGSLKGIAVDAENGFVYATGQHSQQLVFGNVVILPQPGNSALFFGKWDLDGNEMAAVSYDAGQFNDGESIAVGPDGTVAFSGVFGNANPINVGGFVLNPIGDEAFIVALFDKDFGTRWAKAFGGSANGEHAQAVTIDPSGDVYIAGRFKSSDADFGGVDHQYQGNNFDTSMVVLKLSAAAGETLWSRVAMTNGFSNEFNALTADPNGHFIAVAGLLAGDFDFGKGLIATPNGSSLVLLKLDAQSGATIWQQASAGTTEGLPRGLHIDTTGSVYLTGKFLGATDFGGGLLDSLNGSDGLVLKLNP